MATKPKPDRFYKRERHRRQKSRSANRTIYRIYRLREWGELSSDPITVTEIIYRHQEIVSTTHRAWAQASMEALLESMREAALSAAMRGLDG